MTSWVNERQIQTTDGKFVTESRGLLVWLTHKGFLGQIKRAGYKTADQGLSAHADDADIQNPYMMKSPMVEVQTTVKILSLLMDNSIRAKPEFNNRRKG
ncbi:hypothetical protein Tco_0682159 [Tanacetum coccineum]|uniref:Uncharacterized protein n=1 Tax=Tanacetum coccineum TaxID=301880 RepID=A0ABQ4XRG3_9ASTR